MDGLWMIFIPISENSTDEGVDDSCQGDEDISQCRRTETQLKYLLDNSSSKPSILQNKTRHVQKHLGLFQTVGRAINEAEADISFQVASINLMEQGIVVDVKLVCCMAENATLADIGDDYWAYEEGQGAGLTAPSDGKGPMESGYDIFGRKQGK